MSDNQFSDLPSSFIPPESGQQHQSLFGGPSSQDVDLQPYPESQQNAGVERGHNHDDFDAIMRDIPLMDDHQSDATYHASDEDDSEPGSAKSHISASPKKRKKPVAIKEDSISLPSSPRYRPNKFRGPDSTWRKLTAEERQNAQALETIRARDLAAHLYNSYALRVRARERGQQTTKRNKKLSEAEGFVPSRRWTAWPMSADEVPRADERLRREEDDAWTLRMPLDPRPSAGLEESVIAIMLKSAKDRFGAREWDSKRATSQPKKRHTSYVTNGESVGFETNWGSDEEFMDDAELHPVVQADDDKSRQQLRPMSRNILTQFDQLLMGLHHAQTGDAGGDSSGSELHSDTESVASSTPPRKRDRPDEAARSQSRGRKQSRNNDRAHSGKQHTSCTRGRTLGRRNDRSASRIREGLRDWSEMLGIASMTGWPPAAVMRAAKRCSTLFGEDMAFQSFNEGTVEKIKEDKIEDVHYVEPEPKPEPESPPLDTKRSQPTSRRSRSRARATSTKRKSPSRLASLAPETNEEPPKGKGQHRKMDIVCPVKKCSRHENGFTRTWNLNLHMKRMHPGYRPKSGRPVKVDDDENS